MPVCSPQMRVQKGLNGPVFAVSCRRVPVLPPRTFATTSRSFSSCRPRISLLNQHSTRIPFPYAPLARSYWWSSKPTAPAPGSSEDLTSSSASDGDVVAALSSIQEGSTFNHPSAELGGQPEPSASHSEESSSALSNLDLQDSAALASNPTADLSSSLPTLELASSIPPNDALGSLEALQAATVEFSTLASLDFSHLFSWVWPAGVFLRVFAFIQEMPVLYTSPITCMVLGVFLFRFPLSYFQLKGQKAQAAWAPYQDEFKTLSEQYKVATAAGDNVRSMEIATKLMTIREKTHFSPFAGLLPAFGLMYVGLGAFLGMGRLAAYHKEVVAMGGTGPLANPEGFLWTGWLTDLTAFDPILWVLFTGLTWLNVRRSALDAPKYSPWMARMPNLITPVFAVISLLVRFSAAQMIVGAASIGYTVAQSYALRVPAIRSKAGMQGVQNQEKTLKFPGFRDSWREAIKFGQKWHEEFMEKRLMAQELGKGSTKTRSTIKVDVVLPPTRIHRDQLKIKDAPAEVAPNQSNYRKYETIDAPTPPADMFTTRKNVGTSTALAGTSTTAPSRGRSSAHNNNLGMKVPNFKFPPTLQKDKGKTKGKVAKKSK